MITTHLPDTYKTKFIKGFITIPLTKCMDLISHLILSPYTIDERDSNMYREMLFKLLIRYVIKNNTQVISIHKFVKSLEMFYPLNHDVYFNPDFIDCYYYTVGIFKSLIKIHNIVDITSLEIKHNVIIMNVLTER